MCGGGYSDMWVFNPTSLSWLWMQGTVINTSNAGVYGTLGIAAASNVPGARTSGATWTDSSNNLTEQHMCSEFQIDAASHSESRTPIPGIHG